jgi:chorismate mutase/prephenate dehydratase
MSSTAAAAIRAGAETGTAVVGNSVLADLCGLEVLAKEIQDQSLNQTRFLVIGHERSYPTGRDKTSILFSTPHSPGALLKTLVPFAENGVNLTKIESRPAKNVPWNYIFFVDFEGHLEDEKVNRALHALRTCVNRLKILGSYPAGQLLQERSGARHNLPVVHRVLGQSQCERRPTKSVGSGPSRAGHTGGGNQGPHGVPNPCSRG